MKKKFVVVAVMCACAALVLVATAQTVAQDNKADANPVRYAGTIKILNKDAKTISIQSDTAVLQFKYNDQTKYTYRNQPSSVDEVKEGRRVIILVDPNKGKELVALRIDVRE